MTSKNTQAKAAPAAPPPNPDAPPGSDPAVLAERARIAASGPPPQTGDLALNEPEKELPPAAPPIKWLDMADCPRNGTPILLRNDAGFPEECYFYSTRALKDGRWQNTGWFTRRFGERKPIDFEPQGFIFVG